MTENIKLENKLKALEGKPDNELIPVKLTVAQVRQMLQNGNGEVVYHKLYADIMG